MTRFEIIENAKEAKALSLETGASIRPDEYPAVVVLIFNPDDGVEGRPDVLILTWAQVVYMVLMKKNNRKTATMLKHYLTRDLK